MVTVLVSSLCFIQNVHASTPVNGFITTDTTWTAANSPYELTGPVCIYEGATLTIEPGVTVNLGIYYLQVNGTLKAQGRSDNIITFTSDISVSSSYGTKRIAFTPVSVGWDEQTQSGSIIENAAFYSASIFVLDSSPKICNNIFPNARGTSINIGSGSPFVCNNEIISAAYTGTGTGNTGWPSLAAHGSPTVINNTIVGNGCQFGMTATQTAYVANNIISSCWSGIKAADSATIVGNVIFNSYDTGIVSESNQVTISNNYIADNRHYGIVGGGIIQKNTIANHQIGIKDPFSSITLSYNNILNSSQNSIYLSGTYDIDATNNWWGTTDTQAINQTIYDFKRDFNLGTVNFVPFLTEPVVIENGDVTPLPTATTATPTVEPTVSPSPLTSPDTSGFSIESNSTVSAFSFDASLHQISFYVSGPDGTTGYVKITIAKTLMPNSDAIKVYVDGTPTNYELDSNDNSWILTFTYQHSAHQVTINSEANLNEDSAFPSWVLDVAIVAVAVGLIIAVVCLLVWLRKKKA